MHPTRLTTSIMGVALLAASFFLPAVNLLPDGGMGPQGIRPGWFCAMVGMLLLAGLPAMILHFSAYSVHAPDLLPTICIALGGLVNPALLVYLSVPPVRKGFSLLILTLTLLTWIGMFCEGHLSPLIGHFVWIAGIIVVISPELGVLASSG